MDSETHAIDQVEDQPHGHAELLKVEIAVVVHVGQVPHLGQLVLGELTVLEDCGRLRAGEVGAAIGQLREDLPVPLDLPLLDPLLRHDSGEGWFTPSGDVEPRLTRPGGGDGAFRRKEVPAFADPPSASYPPSLSSLATLPEHTTPALLLSSILMELSKSGAGLPDLR